jgi:hypothetical protein
VRHGTGGFEEHEGVVGRSEVGAAGAVVVGEGADVEDRVVAAQRELEAVLAVLGSMAGAGAATGGGDDGGDVAYPFGGWGGFDAGDGDLCDDALPAEGGGQVEGAAGDGPGEATAGDAVERSGLSPGDEAGDVGGVAIVEVCGDQELPVGVGGVEVEGGGDDGKCGDLTALAKCLGVERGEGFAVRCEVRVCFLFCGAATTESGVAVSTGMKEWAMVPVSTSMMRIRPSCPEAASLVPSGESSRAVMTGGRE